MLPCITAVPGFHPVCPAGIPDRGRLRHFHTDMGVVPVTAAMPAPVVPRKRLVYIADRLHYRMDAGFSLRLIPVVHKCRCPGLRASHGMEHKPLYGDRAACPVAAGLCKIILDQL